MKLVIVILFYTSFIAVHAKESSTSLIESKILGGQYVDNSMQEKYSYVVFIKTEFEEEGKLGHCICSGSIISALHILSAAHCTLSGVKEKYVNVDGIRIRVGSNYRTKGLEYDLTALYLPRGYIFGRKFDPNDIAVMLLRKPVSFSKKVSKIDILETESEFNAEADALGWGKEDVVVVEYLVNSKKPLKIVTLKTITETECKSVLKNRKDLITKKHICAMGIKEDENVYDGDSGAPLVQGGKIIGVCSSSFYLNLENTSVFVSVFYHLQFIEDAMNYKNTHESSSSSSYKEKKHGLAKLKKVMCGNSHKENEAVQYISESSFNSFKSREK